MNKLESLALNMIWSWTHGTDNIWKSINAPMWELTQNPWAVLQAASKEKLDELLSNREFVDELDKYVVKNKEIKESPGWFQKHYESSNLKHIAYFSMEYMLSESLPIYSGGLGNVAGDQLKAASDLGVPVSAVGLLYAQGYFRQIIGQDGNQQALYPFNDPGQLPIRPLRDEKGEWIRLEIKLPSLSLWLRTWYAEVGKLKLYLLDSNDIANPPAYRGVTSELYGGCSETRLKQEVILGIGGYRLLRRLGIKPDVCHLNEGHAAFAILERARWEMEETGCTFKEALAQTRVGNLFTTHTAVAAGFDLFSPDLLETTMVHYIKRLKIPFSELLALGQVNPGNPKESFNMAILALRGSGAVNAVSKLHSEVSKLLFAPLFPRWPEKEIPIGYVTNGVHMPSWDSQAADKLWTEACGERRWLESTEKLEDKIRAVPDEKIWVMRNQSRKSLINYARSRLTFQMASRGDPEEMIEKIKTLLDPNILTLGFARRFATYKRPNLLLHDKQRLLNILKNKDRPMQLLIAGKAHPADKEGQALIKEWIDFIKEQTWAAHVVFLGDYDMLLTENLVQGVDVWINNPRRPWEACGTSGMKILVNGGLNVSVLDGWWQEAYEPDVGWALSDGDDNAQANQLYSLLEDEIGPQFYARNSKNIPENWLKKVRESMARLTSHYNANRTVREYTEKYYLPAAKNYAERQNFDPFQTLSRLEKSWPEVHFKNMKVDGKLIQVEVELGDINPDDVQVELYSENSVLPMKLKDGRIYYAETPDGIPAEYFTPRIIPKLKSVSVPLEANEILWGHS